MKTIELEKVTATKSTTSMSPGILQLLKCKCPRCREGDMFQNKNPYVLKSTMKMNKTCPRCGQPFNIEVGFYYGSSYVSYAFGISLSAVSFFAWWLLIGFSIHDNRIFSWIIFNAIFLIGLQPWLMRVARTIWLAFFVRYDGDWKIHPISTPERTNDTHENNW